MNQALENPWPARCRAKPKSRQSAGLKNTTASAAMHPFLVPPKDSTSTPAFHVSSAGVTPSPATAPANRAPSMCSAMPSPFGHRRDRRDLVGAIGSAEFGDLGDAGDHRPPVMDGAFGEARHRLAKCLRRVLPLTSLDADELGPAEEFRRAGLVDIDVRVAMAEDDAAGPRIVGDAERVGRRARADEEDLDLALEELGEALLDGRG